MDDPGEKALSVKIRTFMASLDNSSTLLLEKPAAFARVASKRPAADGKEQD